MQVFSTEGLEGAESVAAWRRFLGDAYYDLDVRVEGDSVRASMHSARLGSLGVTRVRCSALDVRRHRSAIAKDVEERHALLIPSSGSLIRKQMGSESEIRSGGAALVLSSEPYALPSPSWTEHVTLTLPSPTLRDRLPRIDDLCANDALARHPLLPAIGAFARELLEADVDDESAASVEEALVDLVCTMFDSAGRNLGAGWIGGVTPIPRSFHAFLRDNLGDPGLDARSMAAACGLSLRSLHRRLAGRGTTFRAELRQARLHAADRMLRADRHGCTPIGEIACRCGFASQTHFATAYRRLFGRSPRETRRKP